MFANFTSPIMLYGHHRVVSRSCLTLSMHRATVIIPESLSLNTYDLSHVTCVTNLVMPTLDFLSPLHVL